VSRASCSGALEDIEEPRDDSGELRFRILWLTDDAGWGVREKSRSDLRGSAEGAGADCVCVCVCELVGIVAAADAGVGSFVSSARRVQVWEKERMGWRALPCTRVVLERHIARRRLVGRLIIET
jgi:hypothetical protein